MGLAKFSLDLQDTGRGTVEVNGGDLSSIVRRVALLSAPGQTPVLQIEVQGSGTIEGEGIVKVILDEDQAEVPLTQAVLRFLDSIDPTELEQAALDGGMTDGLGASFLRILREKALT